MSVKRFIKSLFRESLVFAKAQLSAFIGGVVDYFIMIFVTEVFGIHYTISICISGIIGAIVNFSLNRYWSFHSRHLKYIHTQTKQIGRFIIVVINSIVLKSAGTYFITTYLRTDYKISRIITDLFVSLVFNYMLQRHWVFRKQKSTGDQI
jgi:putative flippase GtrA